MPENSNIKCVFICYQDIHSMFNFAYVATNPMIIFEDHLKGMNLSDQLIQTLYHIAHKFSVKPDQHLLISGQICDKLYFIEEGIFREYKELTTTETETEAETEKTIWLLGEGSWMYSAESYILAKPSNCFIQALSKASGYFFYKQELEALLKQNHELAYVAYKLSELYILKLNASHSLQGLKTLPKRLQYFESTYPELAGKIKGKILASFLNVQPQQLSKLRSDLAKGK